MSYVETMIALAEIAEIFKAAQVLERNNLLQDRTAASVVREYTALHPEINEVIKRGESHD